MAIHQQDWQPITHHIVVHSYLRAERDSAKKTGIVTSEQVDSLVDNPKFADEQENVLRITLLDRFRGPIFKHFPQFIDWYKVTNLTHDDLSRLYAINHVEWRDESDHNELEKVAVRKPIGLTLAPEMWDLPILIGHERDGRFAILEGNHRLVAYAGSGRIDLNIPVIIGLSPQRCDWNILDCIV